MSVSVFVTLYITIKVKLIVFVRLISSSSVILVKETRMTVSYSKQ